MASLRQFAKVLTMFVALFTTAQISAENPKFTSRDGFCFHSIGASVPIGKFLLVRRGNEVGALRIVKVTPNGTAKHGDWMGTAQYESVFVKDGHSFTDQTAIHQYGILEFGRWRGFGFHYSWQSGNRDARVGPWKLLAFYPDGFVMTSDDFWNGTDHDAGLQFAGTDASNITDLNANDPRLTWFGYNENRDIPCPVAVPPIQQH